LAKRYFLDTNVLVYSFDSSSPEKRRRAQEIIAESLRARTGVISYQVVQEFLNVALSRFRKPMPVSSARVYLDKVLLPLCEISPDGRIFGEALSIKDETGWSFVRRSHRELRRVSRLRHSAYRRPSTRPGSARR